MASGGAVVAVFMRTDALKDFCVLYQFPEPQHFALRDRYALSIFRMILIPGSDIIDRFSVIPADIV